MSILQAIFALSLSFATSKAGDIDFSGLPLAPNSYWNGSDDSGGFLTQGLFFNNAYEYYPAWGLEAWSGWSYSNVTDNTTPGFTNQYSAITGGGIAGAGSNYAIAYGEGPNDSFIDFTEGHQPASLKVTNSTYAYFIMKNGDPNNFARKFVDSDWFRITITGYDTFGASGNALGSVGFLLAVGTNILNDWATVDLSSLAPGVKSLGFRLESTDTGTFGMNTPAYFALGSVTVTPEPSVLILVSVSVAALAATRRKRRRD